LGDIVSVQTISHVTCRDAELSLNLLNLFLAICFGQRGFRLIGVRTNLIVFVSGIDLIVKTHKKKFPSYHWFRAQRIYYITIAVCSYERGAEKILSLSNILQMSIIQQWELFIRMYIHW